jgi:hypothetical protein
VHKKNHSVKFGGNDVSGVGSDWHRSASSKISALEIWSDADDVSLIFLPTGWYFN